MAQPVYKNFKSEEMEFHFDPSVSTPDRERWTAERKEASLEARRTLK